MNVLFLNPVGILGGGERSLLDLLAVLRTAKPDWNLNLFAGTEGPLIDEATKLGVHAKVLPLPASLTSLGDSGLASGQSVRVSRIASQMLRATSAMVGLPRYLRRLRREAAAIGPSLVHSNGIKSHLVAGYAAPGVPTIWHIRDFLASRPLVGKGLRTLARMPRLAIANSLAVKRDVELVLPGVRVEAIYNGIDTDRFSPTGQACENLDGLAKLPPATTGTIRIGLIATYALWKGQDVLIDAAARLAARRDLPPLRCYIVGGAVYQTSGSQFSEVELRKQITDRGLQEIVGLVPFQRDLPPVYRSLDVVVHASTKPEPFGRTIAEAMACGRAVIVSNAGGAAELFTKDIDAIGVPPGDSASLAETIDCLLRDPQRRKTLGEAARLSAVERFSRVRMGEGILAIYESLVHE